jgi:uncharacterized membrane protein YhaH (DUF805 family)
MRLTILAWRGARSMHQACPHLSGRRSLTEPGLADGAARGTIAQLGWRCGKKFGQVIRVLNRRGERMSMSSGRLYLSLSGRIPRSTFNLSLLALVASFIILYVFMQTVFGLQSTLLLYPFFAWAALALASKRLHDRGQTVLYLLALLIPLFGPLWAFATLCCRVGSDGENQYGEDKLARHADYLTVR